MLIGLLVGATGAGEAVLLDVRSPWRCRFVKGTDLVRRSSGERVRTFMHAAGQRNLVGADWLWYRGCGWQDRSRELYELAAQAAAKLGG